MDVEFQHCPTCHDERLFECPSESRDDMCPEWFCTECGTALLVDPVLPKPRRFRAPRAA